MFTLKNFSSALLGISFNIGVSSCPCELKKKSQKYLTKVNDWQYKNFKEYMLSLEGHRKLLVLLVKLILLLDDKEVGDGKHGVNLLSIKRTGIY